MTNEEREELIETKRRMDIMAPFIYGMGGAVALILLAFVCVAIYAHI